MNNPRMTISQLFHYYDEHVHFVILMILCYLQLMSLMTTPLACRTRSLRLSLSFKLSRLHRDRGRGVPFPSQTAGSRGTTGARQSYFVWKACNIAALQVHGECWQMSANTLKLVLLGEGAPTW